MKQRILLLMLRLVLIGDIVRSRFIRPRAEFQRTFAQNIAALQTAPWRRQSDLESPFTVTLGDEFQSLYRDPTHVMYDVWELASQLAPIEIRVALAIGRLTTDTNTAAAIGMDGPAFHTARAGIEQILKPRKLHLCAVSDIVPLEVEDATARLLGELTANFKEMRWRILARHMRGETPIEIAQALNTSPQNVRRHLKVGIIPHIVEVGRCLGLSLRRRLAE